MQDDTEFVWRNGWEACDAWFVTEANTAAQKIIIFEDEYPSAYFCIL